jgi:hypothetical protein
MFLALSRRFPTVRLRIWGHGEQWPDVWAREFEGGRTTFEAGPFHAS